MLPSIGKFQEGDLTANFTIYMYECYQPTLKFDELSVTLLF